MRKIGWRIAVIGMCLAMALCACTPSSDDTGNITGNGSGTGTTAIPTTTRTTGTPTTVAAAAEPGLELSIPDGMRPDVELLERLAAVCKKNKNKLSLYYKDLERGYTLTFMADKTYQAASVIKAPYVKCLLASGVDGSEKLTMNSKMGGSAHIDSYPKGTKFTVDELMEYAIRYSDNTAYYMLNQRFAFEEFTAYGDEIGITCNKNNKLVLKLPKPRFGYLSARDVGLYFEDIANFVDNGGEDGKRLFSWLITTEEQRQLPAAYTAKSYTAEELKISSKFEEAYTSRHEGYTIGHKYGEQGSQAYHDGAIVWRDHPYVLAITSTLEPYEEESIEVFHTIARLVDQLQTYW